MGSGEFWRVSRSHQETGGDMQLELRKKMFLESRALYRAKFWGSLESAEKVADKIICERRKDTKLDNLTGDYT